MKSVGYTLTHSDWWCPYKRILEDRHPQKEGQVREKKAIYKLRREASEGANPTDNLVSDFQVPEL